MRVGMNKVATPLSLWSRKERVCHVVQLGASLHEGCGFDPRHGNLRRVPHTNALPKFLMDKKTDMSVSGCEESDRFIMFSRNIVIMAWIAWGLDPPHLVAKIGYQGIRSYVIAAYSSLRREKKLKEPPAWGKFAIPGVYPLLIVWDLKRLRSLSQVNQWFMGR